MIASSAAADGCRANACAAGAASLLVYDWRLTMALLDAYDRSARLTPGLLAFAPVAFVVATLGFKRFPAVAIAVGVLSVAGGSYALAILVAHLGRRAQVRLWDTWGGPPTTRFLRTRETTANPAQRDAWRRAIETTTGVSLLSASAEAADPAMADNVIQVAVDQMRLLGQDTRFPLIKAENIQYGFERNLYGFRWVGRVISLACTATLTIVLLITMGSGERTFSHNALLAGAIIDFCFLVAWMIIPSSNRAKAAGERYTRQLFQAVVSVSRQTGNPGGTGAASSPP